MNQTVNVLNVELDNFTAKDAMKQVTEYMKTEPINTVEIVTADVLMRASSEEDFKEMLDQYDMMIAGDDVILESADVNEKKMQEVKSRLFLRMVIRYFHKNQVRVYLLANTEEEKEKIEQYFEEERHGIRIMGIAVVPEDDSADDMIINEINGMEVDSIIACLSSPTQEMFIQRCKNALNVKLWLGVGKIDTYIAEKTSFKNAVKEFIEKKVLKRKIEQEKKKQDFDI